MPHTLAYTHKEMRCAAFFMVVWRGEPISEHPDAIQLISALESLHINRHINAKNQAPTEHKLETFNLQTHAFYVYVQQVCKMFIFHPNHCPCTFVFLGLHIVFYFGGEALILLFPVAVSCLVCSRYPPQFTPSCTGEI